MIDSTGNWCEIRDYNVRTSEQKKQKKLGFHDALNLIVFTTNQTKKKINFCSNTFRRRLNLAEVMDDVGDEDTSIIYIQPPVDVHETSDDDLDDEHVMSNKILQLSAEKKVSRKEMIKNNPIKLRIRKQNANNGAIAPAKTRAMKRKRCSNVANSCDNLDKNKNSGLISSKNCDNNIVINSQKASGPSKERPSDKSNENKCDILNNNVILKNSKRKFTELNSDSNQNTTTKKRLKTSLRQTRNNTSRTHNIINKRVKIGGKKCKESTKSKKTGTKWSLGGESDVSETEFGFTVTSTDSNNMNAADYFELFFDDALIELMIHESSQYCKFRGWQDVNLSKAELRTFLAILIISGYNPLPGKPMYWSKGKDMRNDAIYESMRRDRFDNIMKSLHFASEENLDKSDKYSKLRPVISHLQKEFMKQFSPIEPISHDEAMVEYFGHHGCKQSIRDKPIRFGYKVFCHNTPSGYLVAFDPYQGKTYQGDEEMEKQFGKSAASLLNILDKYPLSKSLHPYHFYCDNYFTSIALCKELKSRGYNCTGTIRANRLGKDCPLTDVKKFAKMQRGYTEVATADLSGDKILLSRWKDNSVVTVASTRFAANPEGTVKRWCKTDKKHVQVPIPHAIYNYNRNMGGTDRTDQNVNAYRVSIRGKKWWWPLFTWMLDVAVQNAWQLARKHNPNLVQLQYRRNLAMEYLAAHSQPPKAAGRKRKIDTANEISIQSPRFDNIGHFVRNTITKKPRRCRGNNCKSKVRTECLKCDVGLCISCFASYHVV